MRVTKENRSPMLCLVSTWSKQFMNELASRPRNDYEHSLLAARHRSVRYRSDKILL